MAKMNAAPPKLRISTRDLVFAFVLTLLVAVVTGAFVHSRHHELERLALPIAHLVAVTLFTLLVMLGGRQSLPAVIAATSIGRAPRPGGMLLWGPVAILAGLIFRFGIGGLGYAIDVALHLFQPSLPDPSLIEVPKGSLPRFDALLIVAVLLGAAVEEYAYRRILQSYFCRKYGLWTGILGVSVAFGAVHASIGVILAGSCLALLYLYSGRLWVAIVAHATANLAVYAMNVLQPSEEALLACCGISAVILVAALAFATQAIRRTQPIYT